VNMKKYSDVALRSIYSWT